MQLQAEQIDTVVMNVFDRSIESRNGFGRRLRALRADRDVSANQASVDSGIKIDRWLAYEKGASSPTLVNLIRMVIYLNLTESELFALLRGGDNGESPRAK